MKNKVFKTSSKKLVKTFDNLLNSQQRNDVFEMLLSSNYQMGWADGQYAAAHTRKHIFSPVQHNALESIGFFKALRESELNPLLKNLVPMRMVANLSNPSDVYFPHTHFANTTVLLYYANIVWENSWYGETIFYSENEKEIELALAYTPGRFVLFDGSIPHSIRPQSTACVDKRITLSIEYIPNPNKVV
jgi:hypothetical protein